MGNVTSYPTGLLDLLKVRDRGQMPGDLATAVSGVIEMTPFYLLNQRVSLLDQNAAPASGVFNSLNASALLTVPAGEVWYVHSFAVSCVIDAGETVEMAPAIRLPGNINQQLGNYYRASSATQSLCSAFSIAPFWAPPGADFGALVSALTVAPAVTILGGAQVTKLRA